MIISVANSIPVQRWSSRSTSVSREAAHAAVDVVDGRAEPAPREHARTSGCRASGAGAASRRAGRGRRPTRAGSPAPGRSPRAGARRTSALAEVVAVVGVAHDRRSGRARRRCRPSARRRNRGRPPARRARPRRARSSREPSVLPLSATTTSPAMPASSMAAQRLADAGRQRVRLVEAGHDDRNLDWLSNRAKLRNALRRILHAGARMTTAPRLLGCGTCVVRRAE